MLDIVVPIFNAFSALQDCLHALETYQLEANQIYLINDASTDMQIAEYVAQIANNNNWQYIEHTNNQGFVKTANQGLKLSENHTILLNSDTIVTKNWLQAFKQCLVDCKKIGTATPWSNNAEICSFPKNLHNNSMPSEIDMLADILFKQHKPQYPEIPTAVGFCMLISKQAKQKVGYFDEQHFGHGYGEENDYSLRVAQAGLKNVICDNAYVAHVGNQSFTDLGLQPSAQTMQRLLVKHPHYGQMVAEFIQENPQEELRNSILQTIKRHNIPLYQELMARS